MIRPCLTVGLSSLHMDALEFKGFHSFECRFGLPYESGGAEVKSEWISECDIRIVQCAVEFAIHKIASEARGN